MRRYSVTRLPRLGEVPIDGTMTIAAGMFGMVSSETSHFSDQLMDQWVNILATVELGGV